MCVCVTTTPTTDVYTYDFLQVCVCVFVCERERHHKRILYKFTHELREKDIIPVKSNMYIIITVVPLLNEITVKNKYSLPRIDDLFD
jgi:hypothetical protein